MPEHEIFAAKASTFKQQDAKSWLNIIKSRSYSKPTHNDRLPTTPLLLLRL